MPMLYLPSLTSTISSVVDVSQWRVRKNLGRGASSRSLSSVDANLTGRVRSRKPDFITIESKGTARIGSKLYFRPLIAVTTSQVEVKSFVASIPSAPPEGSLHRTTVAGLINNANSPAFNGSRLVRGDLSPVSFKIIGQRLEGLEADFIAKNKAIGVTIAKSNIHLSAPSLDNLNLDTQILMGQFAIEPSDTNSLPDQEIEFQYQLKFSDGLGRVYTLEMGYFTVYPALVG